MPVMLGGAALTRRYVEEDCVAAYGSGRVAYARDAFDGLALMDKVVNGRFDTHLAEVRAKSHGRVVNEKRKLGRAADARPLRPVDVEEIRLRRRRADARPRRADAAFLGATHRGAGAGEGAGALSQRAHALSIPLGLPQGRAEPRSVQGLGASASCGPFCSASSTPPSSKTFSCRRRSTAIGPALPTATT